MQLVNLFINIAAIYFNLRLFQLRLIILKFRAELGFYSIALRVQEYNNRFTPRIKNTLVVK